ncbi:hypothetical protein ACS127_13565 [Amphibacillus sp. Q70]|uniref:hypothetical protein n=1 Tax=Amphibacillus sp. Q70 TaxID=3453416 RepID=UPI003F85A153
MNDEKVFDEEIQRTKKKAKRSCLIWIGIFVLIPILFVVYNIAWFSYQVIFKETTLEISHSPNEINTIEVVERGESFSFGLSAVRIKYGRKRIDTQIGNDGGTLNEFNVSVNWEDDYNAIVTLYGDEQEPEIIEISFN